MAIRHHRSGKKSFLVMAAVFVTVFVAGVYVLRNHATIVAVPTVTPPDMTRSFSKAEPQHLPTPTPRAAEVPAPREKTVATGYLRPGIYRCEDVKGAITYGDTPCGEGKLVDTKPTSAGFAENWSITVKQR